MEKEEKYIEATFGRKAPFKVPEGYFDDLASRLMERLPEQGKAQPVVVCHMRPSAWRRWRKAIAVAAASVAVAMMGVGAYVHHETHASSRAQLAGAASQATSSYSSVDAFADYAMLDTDDIYAYMADIK